MPSLIANCLARLVKQGLVSQKAADAAQALHDGMQGRLGEEMGPASADAVAALEAARIMGEQARLRKISIAKQVMRDVATGERQKLHPKGQAAGLNGMLSRDNFDWHPPGSSGADDVDTIAEIVNRSLDREMTVGHENLRSTFAGLKQDRALGKAALGEIFGVDSGNQVAKQIAKGVNAANDLGVTRAKAGGKLFNTLEDYRVPQGWRSDMVSRVTEPEFVNDLVEAFRAGGIKAFMTKEGGPAGELQIPALLHGMYEDITIGGGKGGKGAAFAPQMRVVRFAEGQKGFDAYTRLMDKYGGGSDLYAMQTTHMHAMAREIALVEQFGPNYRAVFSRRLAEARAAETAKKGKYIPLLNSVGTAEKTFKVLTGEAYTVQSEFWAGLMTGIRGWLRGVQLGGATLAAVPGDSATILLAASHNGIDGAKIIANIAATLAADTPAKRSLAARLNVQAYATADGLSSGGRAFMAWSDPKNIGTKVADFIIRASGLQVWTDTARREFAMAFLGAVGERVGLPFKKLDGPFARFLTRYQITPAEWDVLRASPLLDADGARYFDIMSVADPKLGEKLMGGIIGERKFAVVEPDARVQGILSPGAPRGSFVGETVASGAMYHSFSMSMANTHMMRGAMQNTGISRAAYFAKLATATTIAGAMTVVAKDIFYGKDPRRMNTSSFWAQAALQGGGAGIFGDFFSAATNRSGHGIATTLGGPVVGLVSDTFDTFVMPFGEFFDPNKTWGQALRGAEEKWGQGLAQYVKRSLNPETFYTRLFMERMVFDQIQSLLDPQYRKSWQRTADNLKKQTGNAFYWRPGDRAPSRAPDLGNVIQ
jgi:hypothetical protein